MHVRGGSREGDRRHAPIRQTSADLAARRPPDRELARARGGPRRPLYRAVIQRKPDREKRPAAVLAFRMWEQAVAISAQRRSSRFSGSAAGRCDRPALISPIRTKKSRRVRYGQESVASGSVSERLAQGEGARL